jgi:hypothetical protein
LAAINNGQETRATGQGTEPLLDERRLVSRILRHWSAMATRRLFPSKSQVDPWLVGDDWANCTLIALDRQPTQSMFIAVGGNLLPSPGRSLDGRRIADCPPDTLLGQTLSYLPRVVSQRAPVTIEGSATHLDVPILFRSVLLPLAEDGTRIDAILAAANYRKRDQGEIA